MKYKITSHYFLLIVFFIFISCSNNTVRDYTSLKQKALEIPPDFELSPPVVNDDSAIEELPNEEVVEDIEEILTSDNSATTSEKTESSSLEDFIDSNFVNDEKEEVSNEVNTNDDTESLDVLVNDDLADQATDVENTNDTEEMAQDDQTQNNESQETNFTEEKLLDELSNIDDITSLPEEEQLKPEIIEEEVYDDPTVYNDDQDLNDLLNRVDDLLNSYSN
ncbi:hypothetical protein IDH31_01065 [Pelagibacterales bacterium SAG-MED32]|jgi:hypothetical protein|nr:hypothetical protein [Pelagibacterales bacterium SAG-MED32]